MIDNDVVLFNRQPSLHKLSIMAHRVKVRVIRRKLRIYLQQDSYCLFPRSQLPIGYAVADLPF